MNDDVMYTLLADKVVYEEEFPHFVHDDSNLQNVFTPYELCENVINKITNYTSLKNKSILVFNLEFAIILLIKGYNKKNITFVTDSISKFVYAKEMVGIEAIETSLMKLETVMANRKFDVVIMNPPYQSGDKTIWPQFVELSYEITKENGIVTAIHPAGWRNNTGEFVNIKNLIQSKRIQYLEIHDVEDGKKTFGPKVNTRYDWYVIENTNYEVGYKTEVKDQGGVVSSIDIGQLPFIPNSNFNKVFSLIAHDYEEKVELLSNSSYHTQKKKDGVISDKKSNGFKYPCIQNVGVNNDLTKVYYSNTNQRGHFGIPKVIFGRFAHGVFVDYNGEYGMCQDCSAIIVPKEELDLVAKALQSESFINLMKSCHIDAITTTIFNKKILRMFRKDFWKEFV